MVARQVSGENWWLSPRSRPPAFFASPRVLSFLARLRLCPVHLARKIGIFDFASHYRTALRHDLLLFHRDVW